MSYSQAKWVVGAAVVSESAWLFSVLGVLAVIFGMEESLLTWSAVVGLMGLSVLVIYLGPSNVASVEVDYLIRVLIAAAAVYLVVGTQLAQGTARIDLAWAVTLASGSQPDGYAARAIAGAAIGGLLWWRGARLASVPEPVSSLSLSFRVGIFFLALAALLDIFHSADLNTYPMIFIFFAAGLGGLIIGHLMPESELSSKSLTWPRVIVGMVSALMVVGVVVSLSQRGLHSFLSAPLATLGALGQGVFWVILAPIFLALDQFTNLVLRVFDRPFEPDESSVLGPGGDPEVDLEQMRRVIEGVSEVVEAEQESGGEGLALLMQILQSMFIIALAAVILYLVIVTMRRLSKSRSTGTRGEPESIRSDASPASDLARLLMGLRPDWFRRRNRKAGFIVPDGPPGIASVLRIYYHLLSVAERRGFIRHPYKTPSELQPGLEEIFPGRLVPMATAAFNRAYYGHMPASQEQIDEMRASVSELRASPSMGRGPSP